ncbi:N-acetylmuramoyl-L-alanine amidase [Oceanicella actignis]|uniref:N-acetylmuramoyl-L-alanine amidase n=1 Tax=Oceanicella actignis TaxID=1189325 RepID=A0A1M7SB56_9RHOB|nr:N-acetylmuramoyl-L-alanine amidase [Oceanicella actignis]TYO91522.1 N-acetylmuramoyl-L-alanine amidase [Oceanicella actignis]SET27832.1 N-acetylmuramoyl-L-alanine amidase [Oceanicella actignis]SHN55746.1 N-acetylmuramoyl-L-alanine amidase [Oceanicella actignis]
MSLAIAHLPSPNHGPRRGAAAPDMAVLHHTAMERLEDALARLRDPAAEVSAHYVIARDGRIFALVPEERRAWHAGVSFWAGERDVNSRSIGIELDHPGPLAGAPPYFAPQMLALERLLADIMARWGIVPSRVVGHSDVAPGRKSDPGPKFDWRRLALRGLALWSDADGAGRRDDPEANRAAILRAAARLGYAPPADAAQEAALMRALQLRFAPHALGAPPGPLLAARLEEVAEQAQGPAPPA